MPLFSPAIVGVHCQYSNFNGGYADHYVVLSGYGVNENGVEYYRYYDPGTSHFNIGTNPLNRLYLINNRIIGSGVVAPFYTVSQVRY